MAHILVVDDDELLRRAVTRMLKAAGHEVTEATTGQTGLNRWRDGGADLVVTDLAMPEMTGFELMRELRAAGEVVPVIAMSGSVVLADLEAIRQAELLGGVYLLAKPFSWDQLMTAVGAALSE